MSRWIATWTLLASLSTAGGALGDGMFSSNPSDGEEQFRVYGVVTLEGGKYGFNYRPLARGPARGAFVDSRHTRSGSGILHVTSNASYTDEQQMFAAGYLEGWLTAERIFDHFQNMHDYFNMSSSKPIDWLVKQDVWARAQVGKAGREGHPMWRAIGAVLKQFDGLLLGYNDRVAANDAAYVLASALERRRLQANFARESSHSSSISSNDKLASSNNGDGMSRAAHDSDSLDEAGAAVTAPPLRRRLQALSRADLLMVSGIGDLGDLIPALDKTRRPAWHAMGPERLSSTLASRGKCSALVKVTCDLSDILMAHSSWYTYAAMQRIYKHYDLPLRDPAFKMHRSSHSSYAGELSSDDDFYLLGETGLTVLQTTNDILNTTLYDSLTPQSLTSWQRVRAANMIAATGPQWAAAIDFHQSGTCNNQYMVVDRKLFRPRQELQAGLLTVVEQIPGLTVSSDETRVLQFGFWPSYNVPFFPEIYKRSGYRAFREEHAARGPAFKAAVEGLSYQLAPRADLFRRDEGSVEDIDSLLHLMRSNDWRENTQISRNNSLAAICGRGDVSLHHPRAYGCYDTKATSWRMAAALESVAVVGPTVQAGMQPFQWSSAPKTLRHTPHRGQPNTFDFRFQLMSPRY